MGQRILSIIDWLIDLLTLGQYGLDRELPRWVEPGKRRKR
jgi:hypothetical protein